MDGIDIFQHDTIRALVRGTTRSTRSRDPQDTYVWLQHSQIVQEAAPSVIAGGTAPLLVGDTWSHDGHVGPEGEVFGIGWRLAVAAVELEAEVGAGADCGKKI